MKVNWTKEERLRENERERERASKENSKTQPNRECLKLVELPLDAVGQRQQGNKAMLTAVRECAALASRQLFRSSFFLSSSWKQLSSYPCPSPKPLCGSDVLSVIYSCASWSKPSDLLTGKAPAATAQLPKRTEHKLKPCRRPSVAMCWVSGASPLFDLLDSSDWTKIVFACGSCVNLFRGAALFCRDNSVMWFQQFINDVFISIPLECLRL